MMMLQLYLWLTIAFQIASVHSFPDNSIEIAADNQRVNVLLRNIALSLMNEIKSRQNQNAFNTPELLKKLVKQKNNEASFETESAKSYRYKRSIDILDMFNRSKTGERAKLPGFYKAPVVPVKILLESPPPVQEATVANKPGTSSTSTDVIRISLVDVTTHEPKVAESTTPKPIQNASNESSDISIAVFPEVVELTNSSDYLPEASNISDLLSPNLASRRSFFNRGPPITDILGLPMPQEQSISPNSATSKASATATSTANSGMPMPGYEIFGPNNGYLPPIEYLQPGQYQPPIPGPYPSYNPYSNGHQQQNYGPYPGGVPYPGQHQQYPTNYQAPGIPPPYYRPHQGGKRAGGSPDLKRMPPPIDICNTGGITDALPTFLKEGKNQGVPDQYHQRPHYYGNNQDNLGPGGYPGYPMNSSPHYNNIFGNTVYNPSNVMPFRENNNMAAARSEATATANTNNNQLAENSRRTLSSAFLNHSPLQGSSTPGVLAPVPLYLHRMDEDFDDDYADFGGFFGGLSRALPHGPNYWTPLQFQQPPFEENSPPNYPQNLPFSPNQQPVMPNYHAPWNGQEFLNQQAMNQGMDNGGVGSPLDSYLETLQRLIDSDYEGLKRYDWVHSTIIIETSLQSLIDSYMPPSSPVPNPWPAEPVQPYGLPILPYLRSLYKKHVKYVKPSDIPRPPKQDRKGPKLPRPRRTKYNRHVNALATMQKFREDVQLLSRESFDQNSLNFLINLKASLANFHDVIKHVALLSTYNRQNSVDFEDIKNLYFRTTNRKNLLELLLHFSAAKLFDYLEQSSVYDNPKFNIYQQQSLMNGRIILQQIRNEFSFVKQILDELDNYE